MVDISRKRRNLDLLLELGRLRREINLAAVQLLKPLGLGPKQAMLIRHLRRSEVCSMAELSLATATDPAATGRAVESLVKKGLLVQAAHPTDRRRWEVRLTARGTKLAGRVEKVYGDLSEILVSALSDRERRDFFETLQKILAGFTSAN